MIFYQVENGWMGESYVRAYVWAENEAQARVLALKAFMEDAERNKYDETYYNKLSIQPLFSNNTSAFYTIPSGDGWKGKRYLV